MRNLLVAQSGGPTSAINATLAGIVMYAQISEKVDRILGAVNGIEGVLEERLLDLGSRIRNAEELQYLCQTPAAALGSCRMKLSGEEQMEKIVGILKQNEISWFVYIGGNDSMDTVAQLSAYCVEKHIEGLSVMGAPKTIDNDLMGTDHCPGFGSAAKYIGITFAELERDCHVYDRKAVTIVEVMGRNAGWLTAASALSRVNGGNGPDLIYLCEAPFSTERFLQDVRRELGRKDAVLVAVSEGVKTPDGKYLSESVQANTEDGFGHAYIAGAARVLEELVRKKIRCKVRAIELNLMQRCAAHIRSSTDISESRMLGMKAAEAAVAGYSGKMSSIIRLSDEPYEVRYGLTEISRVANLEKKVPDDWMNAEKNDVNEKMMAYLRPLILGEGGVVYRNGIPAQMVLY